MDSTLEEKHSYLRSMRFCATSSLKNTAVDNQQDNKGTMLYSGLKSYNVWPTLRRSSINSSGIELKVNDETHVLKVSPTTIRTLALGGCGGGENSPNIAGKTQSELELRAAGLVGMRQDGETFPR